MKKIFFLFAALISAMTMSAVTYNVTVPAGTKACYIAGEMNSWSFTEMTKVDDTHYTLELADATDAMKYKYCSGPGWAYVEKTANGEEVADRTYFVEDVVEAWAAVYEPSATPEEPGETKDITVKAKVPAAWTNTITAWVWPTGGEGSEVVPTQEGEWYVYTHNCTELNIIFKNGAGWTGDANQTVDMTFSADACIEITAGSGKATYTNVDCGEEPGEDPVEPTPDPETGVTYNVTVPAGTNACYIAGEMNTWSHTEMTKVDETHYTITIAEATKAMKYKYCSGPDWAYVEMHADGVTDVQDRTYAENDVVEAWKAVYTPEGGDTPVDPTPDPETGVTYNVTVPAGTNACYIAGEMNAWSHTEMTKVDETHYTITIAEATKAMKYKYCSGPDWAYVEMHADGVTDVQDRTYAENDVVEAWKAVYTPEGGDTPVDPTPDPETGVTYNVTVPAGTKACYIAGEMNAWSHTEMTKVDETHYTITIAEATTAMGYKYCSGPAWDYVECGAEGEELENRVYSENDVVVAWRAVYNPEGGDTPVDPTPDPETGVTYNVTVPAGTNACYIAGEMNAWSHTEMTKVDETHYTITIAEATTVMGYKYCSGPAWDYVECGAEGEELENRVYSENDVVVAWRAVYNPEGGDTPVDPTPDPETGVTYNVTVPAGTNACYIAGEMNAWSHTEMTKVDETHYTITIAEATTAMKYKYCSGPGWEYVEKDANGEEIADRTYSENDVVATWLAVYEPTITGVDNIDVEKKAVKVIRDGQMFIIRDNVVYSVLGQVVK